MLNWINEKFKIIAVDKEMRENGTFAQELVNKGIILPDLNGIQIVQLSYTAGKYNLNLVLLGAEEASSTYYGYDFDKHLKDFIPVADDGGDRVLMQNSEGLFRFEYSDFDPEDGVYISKDLIEFLETCNNIDLVIE